MPFHAFPIRRWGACWAEPSLLPRVGPLPDSAPTSAGRDNADLVFIVGLRNCRRTTFARAPRSGNLRSNFRLDARRDAALVCSLTICATDVWEGHLEQR